MEVKANEAFDVYRELYYEGGVSSVYFWNLDDGFAGVVLLKKGEWDTVVSFYVICPWVELPFGFQYGGVVLQTLLRICMAL